MAAQDEIEWLRPVDLMVDSDAPEQIALELGSRHGHYLREAQRLVLDGLQPDPNGLAEGIRGETQRYLRSHPWFGHESLEPAVTASESKSLAALAAIVAAGRPAVATPQAASPQARPVRRLALQSPPTIVGNMALRKRPTEQGVELEWDAAANVAEWSLRVSIRPDPRREYVEGEAVTLPGTTTSAGVELDEQPRRIQLYGHARDGRIVRRAVVSSLTNGNSTAQWKRQATAS